MDKCLCFFHLVLFHYMMSYNHTEEETNDKAKNKSKNVDHKFKNWFKNELLIVLTLIIIVCLFFSVFRSGIFRITNQFLSIIFVDYYGFNHAGHERQRAGSKSS